VSKKKIFVSESIASLVGLQYTTSMQKLSKVHIFDHSDYRSYLTARFTERRSLNKGFSLGAWAQRLGLSGNSALVMILKGQRNPSPKLTEVLISDLKLNNKESVYFRDLVLLEKCDIDDTKAREEILKRLERSNPKQQFRNLTREHFEAVSQWHHYAIRELADLPGFQEDPKWIQNQLRPSVPLKSVQQATETLENLGLLARDEKNDIRYTDKIMSQTDVPDEALKQFHETMLSLAATSLRDVQVEKREISGMTFTIAQKNLSIAKELVRNLYHEMTQLGPEPQDAVYHLEVALFPLTKTERQNQ
jgi:uncharacterized protein (TIGR02147 family)